MRTNNQLLLIIKILLLSSFLVVQIIWNSRRCSTTRYNTYFVTGFSITTDNNKNNNYYYYSSINRITQQYYQQQQQHQQRRYVSTTQSKRQQEQHSRLYMIQNIFGGGGSTSSSSSSSSTVPTLPRDVKEAITKCREATQKALQDRISRMDIDFPVGTKFGVEKKKSKSGKKQPKFNNNDNDDTSTNKNPTKDEFDTSDRELARIFIEMFQPVGSDKIVVTFNDINLAERAKQQWKDDSFFNDPICRVMSLDRRKTLSAAAKKAKKSVTKPKGFAAKLAAEIISVDSTTSSENEADSAAIGGPFALPDGTEVAIFVAPGPKEIPIIEKVCATVGMGTLVILLNARKYSITNFGTPAATKLFNEEFVSVFHLSSVQPQDIAPGCLIYHTYQTPAAWIVARKPSVGPPKTIFVSSDNKRPSNEIIQTTYNNLEISDIEKNVETAIENVAKWFR